MKISRERASQQTLRTVRCALYIRNNHDTGESTAFNAVRQQREALQAFLESRKKQGWIGLAEAYQDIGHSAGTMNRPALQRLLADVQAGKVDCVVIHTLDRLTRSFSDQATLFAMFRRYDVMLVTVCDGVFLIWGNRLKDGWLADPPRPEHRKRCRRAGKPTSS